MSFNWYTFYEKDLKTISTATLSQLTAIESAERALITGVTTFGYNIESESNKQIHNVDPIYSTRNNELIESTRELLAFFDKIRTVYAEELKTATNIILVPVSENIYKFILVFFRTMVTKRAGFVTYGSKIAISPDSRMCTPTTNNFVYDIVESNRPNTVPAYRGIVIDKTTFQNGKYDF